MFGISGWLVWPPIVLAFYYLGLPLVIRNKQRYPAHPKLHEVDFETVDPQIAKFLRLQAKRLSNIGFDEETFVTIPKSSPIVSIYLVMLVNRLTGDRAKATVMVANAVPPHVVCFIEFSTSFEGGEDFNTHNIAEPMVYPPDPGSVRTQVPTVKNARELFELHRFVVSRDVIGGKKIMYEPGQALAWLSRHAYEESYEQKVKRGWLYYDQSTDCYRPTIRGLYRVAWRVMPPFKNLLISALRRRGERVLNEFREAIGHESSRYASEEPALPQIDSKHVFSKTPYLNVEEPSADQVPLASLADHQDRENDYAEELVHIEQLQKERPSWGNAVVVLVVSVFLFLAAGAASWSPGLVLLMVPVLFFHELGHFLAMRVFKYRNVRMFFIPFFGAAVSGSHYNVPGWKKAVVSLLGPVPGIILGSILGIIGVWFNLKLLHEFASMMLILNGFNLLPLLPLDGGWVLHAILFSRHYLLDTAFRSLAGCLLVALGCLTGIFIFILLGIFLFVGLPMAFRLGKSARRLRGKVPAISPDDQSIPVSTACLILDELKNTLPKVDHAQTRARYTLQVFETLNTCPPGWLATLALATVYAAALVAAPAVVILLLVAERAQVRERLEQAAIPKLAVDAAAVAEWQGIGIAQDQPWAPHTICASYADQQSADTKFHELKRELPDRSAACLFGQTVFIELPADDKEACAHWVKRLKSGTTDVLESPVIMRITCTAPDPGTAAAIISEANAYFDMTADVFLIPPWSKDQELTEEQHKARKTFERLRHPGNVEAGDHEILQMMRDINVAAARGDKEQVKLLMEKHRLLSKEAEKRRLQKIRDEGPEAVDQKIVDLFADQPHYADFADDKREDKKEGRETFSKAYQNWNRQLAERMGQIPLVDGKPSAGADRFSCSGGFATKKDTVISLMGMRFLRPAVGAPALLDWLGARNCVEFRHDFFRPFGEGIDLGDDEMD